MNHWVGESTKYNMGEVLAAVAPVAAQAPYSKAQTKLSKITDFTYFDLTPLLTSEALRGREAGGWGFSTAIINVTPPHFCGKIGEK